MFCQNCGNKLDDDSKFCAKCGAKVDTEEAVQAPAPAPQVEKDEFFNDVPAPAPVQQQIPVQPQPPVQQPPVQPVNQQPVYQPPQTAKTNTFAIIGFVLSFFYYVSIAGLVFSIIGLKQCNKTQEKGKGLAIAGIVISSVLLFINFIVDIVRISYGLGPVFGGYEY